MSKAVCDPESFYSFRNLVTGHFYDLKDLESVERFMRSVVLHDRIFMEPSPTPYHVAYDEEGIKASTQEIDMDDRLPTFVGRTVRATVGSHGDRMVIVGMAPLTEDFLVFSNPEYTTQDYEALKSIQLSPALLEHAAKYSNAEPGNVFYENHVNFLQQMFYTERKGGSSLICSEYGANAVKIAETYPTKLFSELDAEWQKRARMIHENGIGFLVPPILGIVLSRCAKREAIPLVLKELRDELADARKKVWVLVGALRNSRTLEEAADIERELEEASKFFPQSKTRELDSKPLRILWEVFVATTAGVLVGEITGSGSAAGATAAITKAGAGTGEFLRDYGNTLFGRGAFGMANKIRNELGAVDPRALSIILSPDEKQKLGIS